MSSDVVISAENLGKQYRLGQRAPYRTLRESIPRWVGGTLRRLASRAARADAESDSVVWALNDVSFQVHRGEVIGIIGRNGAGKTTLLRILTKITAPTTGRAVVRGRVGSLLEVGTGFHPELTGRENVFLSGAILGMSRAEVRRKFDQIVEFSGVKRFLDTPVKRYSSGMSVRLAFSIAAHLEPEVLLVDEVLAVGDIGFRGKCFDRVRQLRKQGITMSLVSHDLAQVSLLADRCLWIDQGRLRAIGTVEEVVPLYQNDCAGTTAAGTSPFAPGRQQSSGEMEFTAVRTLDCNGRVCQTFAMGEDIVFEFEVRVHKPLYRPHFGIAVYSPDGVRVVLENTQKRGHRPPERIERNVKVHLRLKAPPLLAGSYRVSAASGPERSNTADYASWPDCLEFSVSGPDNAHAPFYRYTDGVRGMGTFLCDAQWELPWE